MNKEKIDKFLKRVRVVATQAFTLLAFCFKKLIGGIKAMVRWLSDKVCVVLGVVINKLCVMINQLKEKAKKQKLTSESCGHDPSTGEKLYPSSGTKAQQSQTEEVASASTASETLEKTESSEKQSSCGGRVPKSKAPEEKKRIVSSKGKKTVPSRMAKTTPAAVAKSVPAPVVEPAPAPVVEPAPAPVVEPAPAPVTAPEEKKRIVLSKGKKSVPSRMVKTTPTAVAKPVQAPVVEPAPAPMAKQPDQASVAEPAPASVAEPAPAPVTEPPPAPVAKQPDPAPVRLRLKKNNSNLVDSATGLPLRIGSRVATTTASGESASSILRERIGLDLDWFCFLGFGVGMTTIGGCLGYGISWVFLELSVNMESPGVFRGLLLVTNWIPMFVISSFMLAWGLYLGMLTNGKRGFVKAFKGWLVTTIIAIAVWFCIKVEQLYDGHKETDRWLRSSLKELNVPIRQHSRREILNVQIAEPEPEEGY